MNAMFTAEDGSQKPFVMGCYGIGVSRVAASAVEQCHDDQGMIWPMSIAPWQVHLLCLNTKKEEQSALANELYEAFQKENIEVLFDDRAASPGVKFNDADLVGIPLRVTVGRDAPNRMVEFSKRKDTQNKQSVAADEIVETVKAAISKELA
jgi:prolyl-tRNA synthetase